MSSKQHRFDLKTSLLFDTSTCIDTGLSSGTEMEQLDELVKQRSEGMGETLLSQKKTKPNQESQHVTIYMKSLGETIAEG